MRRVRSKISTVFCKLGLLMSLEPATAARYRLPSAATREPLRGMFSELQDCQSVFCGQYTSQALVALASMEFACATGCLCASIQDTPPTA